ncbi:MAG: SPFH domain-containing protein [Clostridia bacterium]|nr:SPFH domain-containing protein [Clostridia bacterium]
MGIFDALGNLIKGELIDVIEWTDNTGNTMVQRFNTGGKEIMMGAQLTVRESQAAVFVNEGTIADVFGPGRYELSTSNMPIMTKLQSWKFGFNSPFKAEVYFVNTKQFMDRKWGTSNPVMMRDAEFGMIRLRAFGVYAVRVVDPAVFLREVFGTRQVTTIEDIEGQLKRTMVSGLSDAIAESKIPALDLAANYDELGNFGLNAINPRIQELGLQLTSFVIENISLPEEVEKTMDRRTSMGVIGDMGRYTQYQAAEAMREAANNPAGGAGAGMGMGAGMAMGQMFAQSMAMPQQQPAAAPAAPAPAAAPAAGSFCPECGSPVSAGAKFCANCGAKQAQQAVCPGCGQPVAPGAKFCANCGQKL